jgi:glycosyltransferase involved in cell wall biosynthesis
MESMPKTNDPAKQLVFLLGKRDGPTDGVRDYCEYLAAALGRRGYLTEIQHVDGVSKGWLSELWKFWSSGREWRGQWIVLQYTALAWSRRGFPFGSLVTLAIAKRRGARCAVVFHEPFGTSGPRTIDRVRCECQNWVVRRLHKIADRSIFPDPLETVKWLPRGDKKTIFIPIGANIPEETVSLIRVGRDSLREDVVWKVVVYCLSDPPSLHRELAEISEAVRLSTRNGTKLCVTFLGRGTAEADDEIRKAFEGVPAKVLNLGIQTAGEVKRTLTESDVMVCVRGPLYPRRGSALAGIACGLPIIGYAGAAEGTPLAEAGVELVSYGDRTALAAALRRVLSDRELWQELHKKNLLAYRRYFSWDSIAQSTADTLWLKPV